MPHDDVSGAEGDGAAHNPFTERVTCPVCGQREYDVLRGATYDSGVSLPDLRRMYCASSDKGLLDQLVRCLGCGLVYLNPRVRRDIILDGYRSARDPLFIAQNDARILTFKESLQGIMQRHGISPKSHPRVLDIGCAGGAFPKAAHDLGFHPVGLEPSDWMASEARLRYGLDIRSGILEEADFSAGQFDMVSLWDVIEHLADPAAALRRIHVLLKENGLLIVNYPDHASFIRRLLGFRWPFYLSVHLYYFDPVTITRLLAAHGFAVREVRTHWQKLPLGYVLKRAAAYLPFLDSFARVMEHNPLGRYAVRYTMGQTLVVATRN
ncbi:MAG: class I SAM-dependent methyltransferase [Magnetococcales bacterium]|nr:class I SAM-dependent methyltransferase [Magnetococcales bacterium]